MCKAQIINLSLTENVNAKRILREIMSLIKRNTICYNKGCYEWLFRKLQSYDGMCRWKWKYYYIYIFLVSVNLLDELL